MHPALIDNEWWGYIFSSADTLDNYNLFTIAWLNKLWSSTSFRTYNYFYRANNAYLEASLIEVIYILYIDTILCSYLFYELKLYANNL